MTYRRFDSKGTFREGFSKIRAGLEKRFYVSVSNFSADFGTVLSSAIGLPIIEHSTDIQTQINGTVIAKDLSSEQKEKRKLARRIIKAVQSSLEDAMRKESELCRKPFERELKELDLLLENSILSRRDSLTGSLGEDASEDEGIQAQQLNTSSKDTTEVMGSGGAEHRHISAIPEQAVLHPQGNSEVSETKAGLSTPQAYVEVSEMGVGENAEAIPTERRGSRPDLMSHWSSHQEDNRTAPIANDSTPLINGFGGTIDDGRTHGVTMNFNEASNQQAPTQPVPPTPPLSSEGEPLAALAQGGIPWYMDPFDPIGTTIHEERWTGREVVRGMSEELSDMDEEELQGLVDEEMAEAAQGGADGILNPDSLDAAAPARRKAGGKRKKWRGFR